MDHPHQPVSIPIEEQTLLRLLELAKACAEDYIAEYEAGNPGDHPVTVRRRNRDLADARELLELIPHVRNRGSS